VCRHEVSECALELLHAFDEQFAHFHELGDQFVLALEEVRIDALRCRGLLFELRLQDSDAVELCASLDEANFRAIEHDVKRLVVVLVAELELLEHDFATALAIAMNLVVR